MSEIDVDVGTISRKVNDQNRQNQSLQSETIEPKKIKSTVNDVNRKVVKRKGSESTNSTKQKKVKSDSSPTSSTASQLTEKTMEPKDIRKVVKRNCSGSTNSTKQKKIKSDLSLTSSTASQLTEKTMEPKDIREVVKRKGSGSTNSTKQKKIKSDLSLTSSTASQIIDKSSEPTASTASQINDKSSEPTALLVSSTASQITDKSSEPTASTASQINDKSPEPTASTASQVNDKAPINKINETITSPTSLNNNEMVNETISEGGQHDDTIANYSSEGNDTSLVIQRKRREDREWMKVNDFPTLDDAVLEINKESAWKICSSSQSTILYRCNKVKCRGEQCKSGLRIQLSPYDLSVTLYKSLKHHTCDNIHTKSTKEALTDEVKEIVKIHFLNGFKRRKIEDELIKAKIRLPAKIQLNNFISSLRKEFNGRPTLSVAELDEILKKYSGVPEGDNTGFTIAYKIITEDDIRFNFFVSSKKLLSNATRSSVVCADTTYKLLWQGFPVHVIGNIDGAKQFHPSGIAVSCNEDTDDFKFIFSTLKKGVREHLNVDMTPKFIMSDAAKAIPNAFFAVYGDDVVELMCWYHMKTAAEEMINKIIPSNKREEILNDIDMLQLSQNPDIFEKASKLFLEKHKEHTDFIEYFDREWLRLHRNWFEGAGGFKVPSTDNALETFNRTIKQERTLRERLSLEHFFRQLLTWVEAWGNRYDAGSKEFLVNPIIDLPLLTRAYQWTRQNKVIKKHPTGNFIMVPADEAIDLSEWDKIYKWETFDEFKANAYKGYGTKVPQNEKWIEGTCTFPSFFKKYICKHIVGIAMRLKYLQVPAAAKQIPIGSKRPRGRPSKAKRALLKQ